MTNDIATHDSPVWRDRANFVILAALSPGELAGCWEQLWAHQVAEDGFVICCIPFFAYGLALGDTVSTRPRGGKRYVVEQVTAASGRRVIRLWLGDATAAGRERVRQYLESEAPLHEWSSSNLVAIDVPSGEPGAGLVDLCGELPRIGVIAEWAVWPG